MSRVTYGPKRSGSTLDLIQETVFENSLKYLCDYGDLGDFERCFMCFGYGHLSKRCSNKIVLTYEEFKETKVRRGHTQCLTCKGYGHDLFRCASKQFISFGEIEKFEATMLAQKRLTLGEASLEGEDIKETKGEGESLKKIGLIKTRSLRENSKALDAISIEEETMVVIEREEEEAREGEVKVVQESNSGSLDSFDTYSYFCHISLVPNLNQMKQNPVDSRNNYLQLSCSVQSAISNGDSSKMMLIQTLLQSPDRLTTVTCFHHNLVIPTPFDANLVPYESREIYLDLVCLDEELNQLFEWWKSRFKRTFTGIHVQNTKEASTLHNSFITCWKEPILDSFERLEYPLQLSYSECLMGQIGEGQNFDYKIAGPNDCARKMGYTWGSNQSSATEMQVGLILGLSCLIFDGEKNSWRFVSVFKTKPKVKMKIDEFEFKGGACMLVSKVEMEHLILREAYMHEGYLAASKFVGKFLFKREGMMRVQCRNKVLVLA